MKNDLNRIIVFIGPTMVGKTTVSKNLALKLGVEKFSTDSLCAYHRYYEGHAEEINLFTEIKEWVLKNNIKILDIGGNTIEHCNDETLKFLVDALTINGNPPVFYLLRPTKSFSSSYKFLQSVAIKIHNYNNHVLQIISEGLANKVYHKLNPKVIYTLNSLNPSLAFSTKAYCKNLIKISETLAEEIKQDYMHISERGEE